MSVIDAAFARRFAAEWIAAWNSHDLERILSHYTDDFEMRSPLIIERMGIASGVLKGKTSVRPYWTGGLAVKPPLHFELRDVLSGVDSIALYYRNVAWNRVVVEVLTFNAQRQVVSGSAHYAEPAR